jgi:hypothetical protein
MKRSLPHINRPTRVVLAAVATLGAAGAVLVGTTPSPATATPPKPTVKPTRFAPLTTPAAAARAVNTPYRYGWPIAPFHRQHAVRGFFGDPRIGNHGRSRQFHFGVDVSAPDGTPVYATLTGRVRIHPLHATTVLIDGPGDREFGYWHVVPTVRTGQRTVAYRTVIGHVEEPYAHVHFAEARSGRYVNPLRPGAMGPFDDHTSPTVTAVVLERGGRQLHSTGVRGPFDLVADVRDETPIAVPRPWHDLPVTPALVQWRLVTSSGRVVRDWRTAVDFRLTIPAASRYSEIWAPGTTQNHVRAPGRYRLYLTREIDLRPGSYVIEVAVRDTRGNASRARVALTIAG